MIENQERKQVQQCFKKTKMEIPTELDPYIYILLQFIDLLLTEWDNQEHTKNVKVSYHCINIEILYNK